MKLSHITERMMLIALPLVVLSGAPAARAADDEMAPRRWLDIQQRQGTPAVYSYRNGAAGYGWRYRAGGYQVGPAADGVNDCGVYHYWNGEQCVDARDVPPKY
jgi:hypothetical protein